MPSEVFLETERLVLRELADSDVDNLFALNSDPRVMRFLNGGKPLPREEIETEILPKMLAGKRHWAAIEKSTGQFIGWFGLPEVEGRPYEGELGYRLMAGAWGKGYATEGSIALIRKGFSEWGLERIVAFTMTVNTGSRSVMEKCGLKYVRTFHMQWPETIEGAELGDVE